MFRHRDLGYGLSVVVTCGTKKLDQILYLATRFRRFFRSQFPYENTKKIRMVS
jgi:hypothetical protein